jgi:mRNA interferase RelE/StbE
MIHPSLEGYKLEFSKEALKFLHALDRYSSQRIFKKIKELTSNAENLNIKKIKSTRYDLYRLRIGNYRVIYSIEHNHITIFIVAIGHRKDIYDQIKHHQ